MSPADQPLDSPIDVARIASIYDRTAAFYDGVVAEAQARPKQTAIELLDRRPGERFLEAGVGTGWAFERIVAATGLDGAVGLDVAPGMLDVARQHVASARLVLGDARALPFRDACFDCLLVTYTLEVLPESEMLPLLRDCHRVLRQGGRIAVVNLTDGEGPDAAMTDDWKRRFADDPEYFGGARPLRAASILQDAGFSAIARTYVGGAWPSEVLLAQNL